MRNTRNGLIVALASALGALPISSVHSEEAQAPDEATQAGSEEFIEEVVVTGFRTSLLSSIRSKREADSIVEVITAEDIGGLPDYSIADSLSRVPGLTATRSGGQASDIQIRGLGDEFVFATMKGREQVSPNLRRTIEFNQYPAELINRVTIHKTPKASLLEGGVAGSIDLDIVNPLEMREKRKMHANYRHTYNDRADGVYGSDEDGYRFTFSYQEAFLEGLLGLSLGYSKLSQPNATVQYHGDTPQQARNIYPAFEAPVYVPTTIQAFQIGGLEERDAYLASLQFEPNDQLSIQADYFRTEFVTDTSRDGISMQGSHTYAIANPVLEAGNYATAAHFYDSSNIYIVSGDTSDDDEVVSAGLNIEWNSANWVASIDFSHSSSSGYEADGFHYANLYRPCSDADPVCGRTGYTRQNGQINWRSDGLNVPNLAFADRFDDFSTLRLTQYGKYPRISEDEVSAVKFDFTYELALGPIAAVSVGARYSTRDYDYSRQVFQYGPGSGYVHDVDMPISEQTGDVVCWKDEFSHLPCFISFNAEAILAEAVNQNLVLTCDPQAVYNCDESELDANGQPLPRSTEAIARWGRRSADGTYRSEWSVRQRGDVDEDVFAYYFEVDIDTMIFSRELSGNIGVRIVESEQSSVGIYDVFGNPALNPVEICDDDGVCRNNFAFVEFGDSYTDALPSLNLNFKITPDDYLRFGAATVISRPPINRLSSDQPVDGGGGNSIDDSTAEEGFVTFNFSNTNSPFLRPFEAVQFDLSYEHYFGNDGMFAVAAYYKDVKSFIQDLTIPQFDFRANGFVIPDTYEAVVSDQDTGDTVILPVEVRDGSYTFAINNKEGGYIRGIEFSWTQTLEDFLPYPWNGLGFYTSLAFVDSEITRDNPFSDAPNPSLPYPGLSDRSGNFTLFYELGNFEARVSLNHQDEKVSSFGVAFQKDTVFAAETKVDAQVSYAFDNGFEVVLQAYNLTDTPSRSYWGEPYLAGFLQNFGRSYFLGVSYSL